MHLTRVRVMVRVGVRVVVSPLLHLDTFDYFKDSGMIWDLGSV